MKERYDVVVIGGGTGGLVTASGCARLGRSVALVDKARLGGDCLWTGCVPTKALVATAKLIKQAAHADRYGLEPHRFNVSPRRIMESMRAARATVQKNDDPARFRALGIDVFEETEARLLSGHEVAIDGRTVHAKDIAIATGSRTAVPPVAGLEEIGFLDHASFLAQDDIPKSVIILGGGSIGIEFAQMFRRFGSNVTVVEMSDDIIAREDMDVIGYIRGLLEDEGIDIRTGWAAKAARREGSKKLLTIESKSGEREDVPADEIFVASGRRGNTDNLGLDAAGVKMNRSYVGVDGYLRTNVPNIWACGDVHGGMQFTHVAAYEATKLVRNMLFPGRSRVDYNDVPWALYTDPEVGHIGMTEAEAVSARGRQNVRVYTVHMNDVDRAVIDRTPRGFLKIVADRKGRILGAHVVSANASTLIEELVLARRHGVRVGQLAQLISPYPSLADAVQKAAARYYESLGASWIGAIARWIAAWAQ
ncbi:MAG TPA: FAD-dependent oxidoreductase [Thermoanaerobaculia bacterium]|nr:FAD-dependent oxidoreductase [Thermoanaerobaculia bacterium]